MEVSSKVADMEHQPALCYIPNLTDWKDFVTRPPEEYERWIYDVKKQAAGFEVIDVRTTQRCVGREFVDVMRHRVEDAP